MKDDFLSRNPWIWASLSILVAFLFFVVFGAMFVAGELIEAARWVSR